MAQRRMFSPEIVCSDDFIDMPISSRELYFQLGMRADDDGFIQPKSVMRMLGSSKDDLQVLLSRRFLLTFESGVVVIKHWLIHNMIRQDRYKPTRFQEEKKSLFIKENKAYTDWQPNGNQMAPQVRLGKVRLFSDSTESQKLKVKKKNMGKFKPYDENKHNDDIPFVDFDGTGEIEKPKEKEKSHHKEIYALFSEMFGKHPANWIVNKNQHIAAENLYTEQGLENVRRALQFYKEHKDNQFCPKITSPYDLDSKWSKLFLFKKQNGL